VKAEQVNEYRGLGAPVVFVCCNGTMQLWIISREGATWEGTFANDQLDDLFAKRKEDFEPDRLWRAKNLGRVDKDQQLGFVDIGLMPLLEDEMGEHLGGLMKRVIDSLQEGFTEGQLQKNENQRWIFRAAFWLLCAKILQDKQVKNFVQLDLTDTEAVFETVTTHYGAQDKVEVKIGRQQSALEVAASKINIFPSLSNLTTEAFGYMYENVLVDKKLRSALGIHATPSYLVDYIVWQLWPWIEEIPEEKRIVLEPTCGHAPFLTAAMRLLRFLYHGVEGRFHGYAKNHLVGVEMDSFAMEIARLSLTLADVPNPNGWNIAGGDIYHADFLSKQAKNATILLCNPPFEDFKPKEQTDYKNAGEQLGCHNKAAEVLWRTLPFMPEGSVFGVILPRRFLHNERMSHIRRMLVDGFELSQVCLLPANVFAKASQKSIILLGRKVGERSEHVKYVIIPPHRLGHFQRTYDTGSESVMMGDILSKPSCDLRIIPSQDIWQYCRGLPRIGSVANIGRGLEYKSVKNSTSRIKFPRAKQGFVRFERTLENRRGVRKKMEIRITQLPDLYWMDLSDEAIENKRYGMPSGCPRVLLNYARGSRDKPWRLRPLIDEKGRATTNCCMTIEPTASEWSVEVVWGVLNSPFANAFVFCHSMERHNLESTVRNIPVPNYDRAGFDRIRQLVSDYFALDAGKDSILRAEPSDDHLRKILLQIDAEVMRLYDLPPKMEKRVLDLFQGVQRKGVDFEFKGYYPEGFESAVPLHEFLSEEYQRSTISFVKKWVEDNRSPEIIRAFENAIDAFQDE
jgi:type I restriction-modification system DNA methylase subunit